MLLCEEHDDTRHLYNVVSVTGDVIACSWSVMCTWLVELSSLRAQEMAGVGLTLRHLRSLCLNLSANCKMKRSGNAMFGM